MQSDRPELYQISQVATPSNSSNTTRVSPSSLRPRDPLRRTFGDLLAARRVGHYDSSGLVVTSSREGVCNGAQSLLAPQSALALGRLGESESEFEHETVHSTGRDSVATKEEHLCEESTVSVGKERGQQAVDNSSISGTSGSGSQSSVYGSGSSGREFDSTLGHPGEDLGADSRSHSQRGAGSGSGAAVAASNGSADDSDDSAGSAVSTPAAVSATALRAAATFGREKGAEGCRMAAIPSAGGSSGSAGVRVGSEARGGMQQPSDATCG